MSRMILIEGCNKCPHREHSGSFTKGGAWPVCHFPNLVDWKELNKTLDYNDPEANVKWSPPILPVAVGRKWTGKIPEWCLLPKIGELSD